MTDSSDIDNFDDHSENVTTDSMLGSNSSINISGRDESSIFEMSSLGVDSTLNGDTADGMTFGLTNHTQSDSGASLDFNPAINGQDDTHIDLSDIDGNHANEVSFKGTPQEKAEWAKKAQSEKEWVNFYNKQADSCLIRGDVNGYKQHLADAKRHADYYDKFIANSKK